VSGHEEEILRGRIQYNAAPVLGSDCNASMSLRAISTDRSEPRCLLISLSIIKQRRVYYTASIKSVLMSRAMANKTKSIVSHMYMHATLILQGT